MVCSADDLMCQVATWFSENGHYLQELTRPLVGLWERSFGNQGWALSWIRDHGEKVFAAASLAFGVWRWWVYREAILHKRLEEYINESDRRLEPSSKEVVEAILRPGRTASLPQPAYALELRSILHRHSWDRNDSGYPLSFSSSEDRTSRKLVRTLSGIRKRMSTARRALSSLQEQQAQLHMIAGAIAAAKARRAKDPIKAANHDRIALREFRKVLQVPGHHRDVAAKENEAFQLFRLGKRDQAAKAYEELATFASDVQDAQIRDLTIARSKCYRAQILQAIAETSTGRSQAAWSLMTALPNSPNGAGAITLRTTYQPVEDWDAIEQSEMHYVAAYIAYRSEYPIAEPDQVQAAEASLIELLSRLPKRSWFLAGKSRRLRAEARAGLTRVRHARNSEYDRDWLRVGDWLRAN